MNSVKISSRTFPKSALGLKFCVGAVCVLLILSGVLSSTRAQPQQYVTATSTVNLSVYVIAIDGVSGGSQFGNLSSAVAGALDASSVQAVKFYNGQLDPNAYFTQPVNISTQVVTDWSVYENIVENASNAILVNAHGDILPVPLNYSKEAWVGMIAEAVEGRNVTWVHTGGYPFYYYEPEDGNITFWGQEGFTLFMSQLGIPNVTCNTVQEGRFYPIGDGLALDWTWGLTISQAYYYGGGYSLNCSDFQGKLTMLTGGFPSEELVGVVNIAGDEMGTPGCNSGFYVHIGALETYDPLQRLTDSDFMRSYLGTAAALYNVVFWNIDTRGTNPPSGFPFLGVSLAIFSAAAAVGVSLIVVRRKRRSFAERESARAETSH